MKAAYKFMLRIGKIIHERLARQQALLSFFLNVAAASAAYGSDAALIDASAIKPYSAAFDFVVSRADGTKTSSGSWTDDVIVEEERLVRTIVRYDPDGRADLVRVISADRKTLKPHTLHSQFGPDLAGVMHADFAGSAASQMLLNSPTSQMRIINVDFGEEVWELSLWATLAMSLPFEVGTHYKLPTVSPDRQSVREVTFEVEGRESLTFEGKSLDAMRIFVPEENWRFWVRKSAPYILRIEHPALDGQIAVSRLVRQK